MCGRYKQEQDAETLATYFHLTKHPSIRPDYNIVPGRNVLTIQHSASGEREPVMKKWGLTPSWAKDAKIGFRMINARAETIATKPSFRSAFRHRRCLIVADGFYEWQKTPERGFNQRKQPYLIRMKDECPFAFAGLWESWKDHNHNILESCSIVTTTPNALLRQIHDRMPVILQKKDYDTWLNPEVKNTEQLERLLKPYPPKDMIGIPITTHVNSPKNNDPQCIAPVKIFPVIEA